MNLDRSSGVLWNKEDTQCHSSLKGHLVGMVRVLCPLELRSSNVVKVSCPNPEELGDAGLKAMLAPH